MDRKKPMPTLAEVRQARLAELRKRIEPDNLDDGMTTDAARCPKCHQPLVRPVSRCPTCHAKTNL